MIELAVSGSGTCFVCALQTAEQGLHVRKGNPRGDDLLKLVSALMQDAAVHPRDLTRLRVDVGPGSYTGLRVTLTCARFLAGFFSIPIQTVTSFELLTIAAARVHGASLVRPVLDARRGLVHHALLAVGRTIEVVEEPAATKVDEVRSRHRGELLVVEPSLLQAESSDSLSGLLPLVPLVDPLSLHVEDMFDGRLREHIVDPDSLEPLYLMGTYADPAVPINRTP